MKRREFIKLLGRAAAAWPFGARAQQTTMPVIGFLSTRDLSDSAKLIAAYREGLKESGYVEGRNVAIDYRWGGGRYDRMPELATELVERQVNLIFSPGQPAALAAKAATTTIPIVFTTGDDPVRTGLVASLNHPGGNATGFNLFASELGAKRLGLLRQLLPKSVNVALLVNPTYELTDALIDVAKAAAASSEQIYVVKASSESELAPAFAHIEELHADALIVGADPFFTGRSAQLVALAARYAIPTIYEFREFAVAGGLMSYGTSLVDTYRQSGVYTGRILKGEKPADLPVTQSTKFEFVINLRTAKELGLTFSPTLLATADEVIE